MLRTAGDWFPRLGAAFEHYYHLRMAISFANAAGPSQCFLIGSLLVLVGVALPVVRTKLGKSAGFDGAPTLVELYNEGKGYHRDFRAESGEQYSAKDLAYMYAPMEAAARAV